MPHRFLSVKKRRTFLGGDADPLSVSDASIVLLICSTLLCHLRIESEVLLS